MRILINLAGFQAGWFACVLGAAHGMPWIGPVVVTAVLAVHLGLTRNRTAETALLATAGALGYAAESLLVLAGFLSFPENALLGGPAPLWMAALWMNFAATLNVSLRWLQGRYGLAALLGGVGGPLAYFGGSRLGALEFASLGESLAALAVEWIVATPLLLYTARRLHKRAGQRRSHALAGRGEVNP